MAKNMRKKHASDKRHIQNKWEVIGIHDSYNSENLKLYNHYKLLVLQFSYDL